LAASERKIQKDIQRYQKLLRKEKRLQYYLTLAKLYESAEDLAGAEKALDEAMERFPDLSSVKVALAHILTELDRPEEARKLLEPVLSRDRDNLLAARRLAESYEQSGDLEKALQTFKSILRFRLVGQEVKGQIERLERLLSMGEKKEAKGDSSFVGLPTLSLARLYMEQGHFEEAIKIVNRILSVDPNCEECRGILALAQASLEKAKAGKAETFFPAKESEPEQVAEDEAGKAGQQKAEREAKEQAEREAKEKAERKAKELAEREAKEQAEREGKEEAEREAKEQAEREAKELAEREAKELAEREAKEQAEREAKEQAEREAKEQAEREAKEKAEREAKEQAEREAKEQAEREAKEEAEREAKEEAEREAKELAEREAQVVRAVEDDLAVLARLQQWLDGASSPADGQ